MTISRRRRKSGFSTGQAAGGDSFAAEERYGLIGLVASLLGHVLVAMILVLRLSLWSTDLGPAQIYSVTLEGGKNLGGIAQVPDKAQEKSLVAPPKNVTVPEKVEQKADEKAEVSLQEKSKPTPKTTPVPTKKAEVKATAKPTPKSKEPSVADLNKQYQQAMQRYLGESSEAGGKGFGAGALGGKGMGGGLLRPPEFFQYRDLIRSLIKKGWRWYDTSAALVTTVVFEISEKGVVSNVYVERSSGNREYDESVMRAIIKASPLPPPPQTVYRDFQKVRMNFDPRE